MSRWHDRSIAGAARWGNLSLEERLSDRLADIMIATEEIRDMLAGASSPANHEDINCAVARIYEEASAVMLRLPEPGRLPPRDP
ncbi:MAG TPA: hypothetical protein VN181_10850, partial [Thermoanaerobaculia bacterium]|nr:hypothetical protein [Thermoanaerobaculia bacterium]